VSSSLTSSSLFNPPGGRLDIPRQPRSFGALVQIPGRQGRSCRSPSGRAGRATADDRGGAHGGRRVGRRRRLSVRWIPSRCAPNSLHRGIRCREVATLRGDRWRAAGYPIQRRRLAGPKKHVVYWEEQARAGSEAILRRMSVCAATWYDGRVHPALFRSAHRLTAPAAARHRGLRRRPGQAACLAHSSRRPPRAPTLIVVPLTSPLCDGRCRTSVTPRRRPSLMAFLPAHAPPSGPPLPALVAASASAVVG
jgi:hypothetical protein